MNFSEALDHIKKMRRVARSGWNGKDMYLFLVDSAWITYSSLANFDFADFIAIRAADGKVYPWFASQADLLASDWEVLEN